MDDDSFEKALGELIHDLANRPVEIDGRRVRWCLNRGIAPFARVADGCEAWQLVTDDALNGYPDG